MSGLKKHITTAVLMLWLLSGTTSALGCWRCWLCCCPCCCCCSVKYCIVCQRIADASDTVKDVRAKDFCEDCWKGRMELCEEIERPYLTEKEGAAVVDSSMLSTPPRRSEKTPLLLHIQSPSVSLVFTPKHEKTVSVWIENQRIMTLLERLAKDGKGMWTEDNLRELIEAQMRETRRSEEIPEIAQLWIPGMAFIGWKTRKIPIKYEDPSQAKLVTSGVIQVLRTVQHIMYKALENRVRLSDESLRRRSYDPELYQIISGGVITYTQRKAEPYDYYDSVLYLSATGYSCFSDIKNAEWYKSCMARSSEWQIKKIEVNINPNTGHNPGTIWLVCPK